MAFWTTSLCRNKVFNSDWIDELTANLTEAKRMVSVFEQLKSQKFYYR